MKLSRSRLNGILTSVSSTTPLSVPTITGVIEGGLAPQIDFTITWTGGAAPFTVHAYTDTGKTGEATLSNSGVTANQTYTFAAANLKYLCDYWLSVVDAIGSESEPLPMTTPLPSAVSRYWLAGFRTYEDAAVDIAENDDPAYRWADVGDNYNPLQAVQATRPIYKNSGMGVPNRPFLQFTGTQYLNDASADSVGLDSGDFANLIVLKTTTTLLERALLHIHKAGTSTGWGYYLRLNRGGVNRTQLTISDGVNGASPFTGQTVNDGNPHLLAVTRVGNLFRVAADGVSSTTDTKAVAALAADELRLGGSYQYNAAIADISAIVFGAYAAMTSTTHNGEIISQMLKRYYGTP